MMLMMVIEKPFQHFPSNPSSMLVVVQESGQVEQEPVGDDLEDHFLPLTEQHKRVENLTYVEVGMILPSPEGIDLSLQPFKCDTRHRAGAQHKIADGLSRGSPKSTHLAILMREECEKLSGAELKGLAPA